MRHAFTLILLGLAGLSTPLQAQTAAAAPLPEVALIKGYLCESIDYPAAARRKEAQGVVRLRFTAAPDGTISDVAVIKSAGDTPEHKLLDRVSRRQIASCKLAGPSPVLEPRAHEVELRWTMR